MIIELFTWNFTVFSHVSYSTHTPEGSSHVDAGSSIETDVYTAFVNILLADISCKHIKN